ncbi:hypothetical protein EPI10_011249 [Gossypium australe]|uniref:Uncharacterized protein n=1 Tax=Gossypium australe TaxID=47621 RepID=A0A5B6W7Y4_9ROSI|nr:hypothetical protein EPI10_011249 [Gossypium australe]
MEESCESEVTMLWGSSVDLILDRLRTVSERLNVWFRKVKRKNKMTKMKFWGEMVEVKLALNLAYDKRIQLNYIRKLEDSCWMVVEEDSELGWVARVSNADRILEGVGRSITTDMNE